MVTIYSLEDFVAGRIPRPGAGKAALEMFESETVLPMIGSGEAIGGFAYGSVRRNDFTIASDVDYLLVVGDESAKETVRAAISSLYARFLVEVNADAMTLEEARGGEHTLDEGFRQHLEHVALLHGEMRGRNPLEIIAHTGVPFEQALDSSLRTYLSQMRKGFLGAGKDDEHTRRLIKTATEKPFHAVRVAIQMRLGDVAPQGRSQFTDSKAYLVARYLSLDPPAGSREALETVRGEVAHYLGLLQERTSLEVCPPSLAHKYASHIGKLGSICTLSRTFMQRNYRWLKGIKAAA